MFAYLTVKISGIVKTTMHGNVEALSSFFCEGLLKIEEGVKKFFLATKLININLICKRLKHLNIFKF